MTLTSLAVAAQLIAMLAALALIALLWMEGSADR